MSIFVPDDLENPDNTRLDKIKKAQDEALLSPYNEATVSQQQQDYYAKTMSALAKQEKAAQYGLTEDEKNAAKDMYMSNANMNNQNIINAGGGGLSSYVSATNNSDNNKFSLGLSAQDQEVKRQKQAQVADYLKMVGGASEAYGRANDLNFQKETMVEQALGAAEQNWYDQDLARRIGNYQTEAAAYSSLSSNLFSSGNSIGGMMMDMSDIRLKENITYLGEENGHKIYSFNYKETPNDLWSGVMAQEVMKTNPDAVFEKDGYLAVDYAKIGVEMKKLK